MSDWERPPGTVSGVNCGAQVAMPGTSCGVATCTDHGLGHYDPEHDLSWPSGGGDFVQARVAIPSSAAVDRTGASAEQFGVALAAIEAREADPDGAQEKVARAIFFADAPWMPAEEFNAGRTNPRVAARLDALALAAIHALQSAPQVDTAAADGWTADGWDRTDSPEASR